MTKPAFHLLVTEEQIRRLDDLMHDADSLDAGMHTVADAGKILGNLIQLIAEMVAKEI